MRSLFCKRQVFTWESVTLLNHQRKCASPCFVRMYSILAVVCPHQINFLLCGKTIIHKITKQICPIFSKTPNLHRRRIVIVHRNNISINSPENRSLRNIKLTPLPNNRLPTKSYCFCKSNLKSSCSIVQNLQPSHRSKKWYSNMPSKLTGHAR